MTISWHPNPVSGCRSSPAWPELAEIPQATITVHALSYQALGTEVGNLLAEFYRPSSPLGYLNKGNMFSDSKPPRPVVTRTRLAVRDGIDLLTCGWTLGGKFLPVAISAGNGKSWRCLWSDALDVTRNLGLRFVPTRVVFVQVRPDFNLRAPFTH